MPIKSDDPGPEILGAVLCPSGRLTICDWVSSGDFVRSRHRENADRPDGPQISIEEGAPCRSIAAIVGGLRPNMAYPVTAVHVRDGLFKRSIRQLFITLASGTVEERRTVGTVPVDYGRVVAVDAATDLRWDDDRCRDGLADVVFWGRDVEAVAAEVGAPKLDAPRRAGAFGWRDLPLAEAERRAQSLQAMVSQDKRFAVDLRPHTQQWRFLETLRHSPTGAIEIGWAGSRLIMFGADFGHHLFHVFADLDADGKLLRVVVDLERDPFE